MLLFDVEAFPLDIPPHCHYCGPKTLATCKLRVMHKETKKYLYIPSCDAHKRQIAQKAKRWILTEIER